VRFDDKFGLDRILAHGLRRGGSREEHEEEDEEETDHDNVIARSEPTKQSICCNG
jgi:hypothetical protein